MSSADQWTKPVEQASKIGPVRPAGSLLCRAAEVLGWDGVVVDSMRLLSQRVTLVASLDQQVHAARLESGWGPVTDCMSVALWDEWPEQYPAVPPSAVRLVGFMARGRRWQHVLAAAGGFVGFGSTAILLERDRTPTQLCTMTAHFYGVAVARYSPGSDAVELVQEGRQGPVPTARPTAISRWVEELVYQEILDRGLVARAEIA